MELRISATDLARKLGDVLVPSQPRTFYMGVASGGVFRTTDGGASWVPITDGKVPVASIGDIAVANSDPNIIYVGRGSDGVGSNVSTGRGVNRTTNGGETWQFAGLYNVGQIGAVRIHPTNPDIVWVAANGDIFKPNSERGIFKTADGGKTWKKTLFVSDSTGAMDVELQLGRQAFSPVERICGRVAPSNRRHNQSAVRGPSAGTTDPDTGRKHSAGTTPGEVTLVGS